MPFAKGQYYRIIKIDLVTFDALRMQGLDKDSFDILNTAIEGEEYPESPSWVRAKELKDKLGSEYYAAKKAFDHECYINRNEGQE